ncbi:hypothetical protein AB5J56_34475 [Streptomyces sp. R21]|uniref:N-acetyltransferase domain-containing protein n=1 Tax=Streptomyces sp. R21 TaxID=3238627 RepID=A0AB39PI14_9ACTN
MIRPHRTVGSLVIRTALPTEAVTIAELHVRARSTYYRDGLPDADTDYAAAWRRSIERSDGHVLCAVRDGRIVGVAAFRTDDGRPADSVRLFQFHVAREPARRGRQPPLPALLRHQGGTDRGMNPAA